MYDMGDGYTDAVQDPDRAVDVYIYIGSEMDMQAADDVTGLGASMLPMSNVKQATDAVYSLTNGLATFEAYGIPTATRNGMIAPPIEATDYPPECGIWSDVISDADGAIDWTLSVELSAEHTSGFRIMTEGPSVTSGTITFTAADGTVAVHEMECYQDFAQCSEPETYVRVDVRVTGISDAYRHVRIPEVEFGAAIALSASELGGTLTLIREWDPLELSMPLHEFDISLINVEGDWDYDNPATRLAEVAQGTPLMLSVIVEADSRRWTVPMGTYWIAENSVSGNLLDVTAYDPRGLLDSVYAPWSLVSGTSLGEQLNSLLTDRQVSHVVDEDLYSVQCDPYDFDGEESLLQCLLMVGQRYAVYFLPQRDGSVLVTRTFPTGDAGTVPLAGVFSWPSPTSFESYNYLKAYRALGETVEMDLREDSSEPKTEYTVNNRLLYDDTGALAREFLERVRSRLYSMQVKAEWTCDPCVDMGDSLAIPGRWTMDEPTTYTVVKDETEYSGALRTTVNGVL